MLFIWHLRDRQIKISVGESSRNFQKKLRVLVLESHSSSSLFFSDFWRFSFSHLKSWREKKGLLLFPLFIIYLLLGSVICFCRKLVTFSMIQSFNLFPLLWVMTIDVGIFIKSIRKICSFIDPLDMSLASYFFLSSLFIKVCLVSLFFFCKAIVHSKFKSLHFLKEKNKNQTHIL